MEIKIDDKKVVFFVTLILKIKGDEHSQGIKREKREVYQTIMKQAKHEQEAVDQAEIEAGKRFTIIQIEAKTVSLLSPKIFLD